MEGRAEPVLDERVEHDPVVALLRDHRRRLHAAGHLLDVVVPARIAVGVELGEVADVAESGSNRGLGRRSARRGPPRCGRSRPARPPCRAPRPPVGFVEHIMTRSRRAPSRAAPAAVPCAGRGSATRGRARNPRRSTRGDDLVERVARLRPRLVSEVDVGRDRALRPAPLLVRPVARHARHLAHTASGPTGIALARSFASRTSRLPSGRSAGIELLQLDLWKRRTFAFLLGRSLAMVRTGDISVRSRARAAASSSAASRPTAASSSAVDRAARPARKQPQPRGRSGRGRATLEIVGREAAKTPPVPSTTDVREVSALASERPPPRGVSVKRRRPAWRRSATVIASGPAFDRSPPRRPLSERTPASARACGRAASAPQPPRSPSKPSARGRVEDHRRRSIAPQGRPRPSARCQLGQQACACSPGLVVADQTEWTSVVAPPTSTAITPPPFPAPPARRASNSVPGARHPVSPSAPALARADRQLASDHVADEQLADDLRTPAPGPVAPISGMTFGAVDDVHARARASPPPRPGPDVPGDDHRHAASRRPRERRRGLRSVVRSPPSVPPTSRMMSGDRPISSCRSARASRSPPSTTRETRAPALSAAWRAASTVSSSPARRPPSAARRRRSNTR